MERFSIAFVESILIGGGNMSEKNLWWNPQRTASYNCLFNFIVGNRGAGKTYGALKRNIDKFLRSPKHDRHQFVYMRRLKEELKKLTTSQNG
ncbi:MAG: phage DNA encapsidation protein, partial [Bacteroidaceae bacterium]|nr:phage DNA encapsidation protein [Bacteroidaceae bacterium]